MNTHNTVVVTDALRSSLKKRRKFSLQIEILFIDGNIKVKRDIIIHSTKLGKSSFY